MFFSFQCTNLPSALLSSFLSILFFLMLYVNGIILMSLLCCSLSVCRYAADFCVWVLCPSALLSSFISASSSCFWCLCGVFRVFYTKYHVTCEDRSFYFFSYLDIYKIKQIQKHNKINMQFSKMLCGEHACNHHGCQEQNLAARPEEALTCPLPSRSDTTDACNPDSLLLPYGFTIQV